MSVQSEIERITNNIAATYSTLEAEGADLPEEQSSDNLAETVTTIKSVRYTEQTLSDEQKAQARTNIGAASTEEINKLTEAVEKCIKGESDPTVPAWAKNPTKPTYTADEVGASPTGHTHDEYASKSDILTKTSELTNDSDFQTGEQVRAEIGKMTHYTFEKVNSLEEATNENVIYLVPNEITDTDNIYDEYLLVDGVPELIGSTAIDLSGYVLEENLPKTLPNPKKLIFTGAVTAEYDGSEEQTINIPFVDSYSKSYIDNIMGSYITDIDTLIGEVEE